MSAVVAATGPSIKRGSSSGDIWTPADFRAVVVEKFGIPTWDLAASERSAFGTQFLTEQDNSLTYAWHELGGLLWLNCPYSNITPWVKKCAEESYRPDTEVVRAGAEILLLVPGSIGANWYWDYVEPYADVYSVGRMVFDNCYDKHGELVTTPYPKDLILCHYYNRQAYKEMTRWRWDR